MKSEAMDAFMHTISTSEKYEIEAVCQRVDKALAEGKKMLSLKEMVAGGKLVHFEFYRKGELWYKTEDGFEFPVPIEDTGDGVFLKSDKAMMFMRYIRKQIANIEAGKAERSDFELKSNHITPADGNVYLGFSEAESNAFLADIDALLAEADTDLIKAIDELEAANWIEFEANWIEFEAASMIELEEVAKNATLHWIEPI
jgi:hypothetical protein